jgi:hypothetical protein
MSRWDLVIASCVILATGTATAAPAGLTITASDNKSDKAQRADNADVISHELGVRLAAMSCDACHIDASVTRLDTETTGTQITISADLNVAISDEHGVVISVFEGRARASGAMRISALRNEALTAAVDGMSTKIAGVLVPRHWLVTMMRGWLVETRDIPLS